MSGRHDRSTADARARAGGSGLPSDEAAVPSPSSPDTEGAGQRGVSRPSAGDGLGMTDRSDAAGLPGDDRAAGPAHDGPTVPMEAVARRTSTG